MATPAAETKACSKCGETKPLDAFQPNPMGRYGRKSVCRDCNLAALRQWRQANPEKRRAQKRRNWSRHKDRVNAAKRTPAKRQRANALRRAAYREDPERFKRHEPEKKRARFLVWQALRDGELVREPCTECGAPVAQAHHTDYSEPLNVTWLCARCHSALHREVVV